MKLESNWRNRTIEDLEKCKWPDEIEYDSHLVKTTTALRKETLNTFTIEDLRIMIGQNLGLDYLIPLALERLAENLFAEGDLYEGDLLQSVLKIETGFWDNNKDYWLALHRLMKARRQEVRRSKIDTTNFYNSKNNIKFFKI